jgi:hypothetical protein
MRNGISKLQNSKTAELQNCDFYRQFIPDGIFKIPL